jgi:hypothetical protein
VEDLELVDVQHPLPALYARGLNPHQGDLTHGLRDFGDNGGGLIPSEAPLTERERVRLTSLVDCAG